MRARPAILLLLLAALLCPGACKRAHSPSAADSPSSLRTLEYQVGLPTAEAADFWTVHLTEGGLLTVSRQAAGAVSLRSSHFLSDEETATVWKLIDQAKLDSLAAAELSPNEQAIQFSLQQSDRTTAARLSPAAVAANPALLALQTELRRLVEYYSKHALP